MNTIGQSAGVRELFVGRQDPVQDRVRFRGRPTTAEMVGVGELDRVGGGVEQTVGRALEQRAHVVRRVRRTGERPDLGASEQNLDIVRRLLRRGADSVERCLRLSSPQVQQRQKNLQAHHVCKLLCCLRWRAANFDYRCETKHLTSIASPSSISVNLGKTHPIDRVTSQLRQQSARR